jgi:hypothetical protein
MANKTIICTAVAKELVRPYAQDSFLKLSQMSKVVEAFCNNDKGGIIGGLESRNLRLTINRLLSDSVSCRVKLTSDQVDNLHTRLNKLILLLTD